MKLIAMSLFAALAMTAALVGIARANVSDEALVARALKCSAATSPDEALIRRLLEIEREHLPSEVRGLLLAAACSESGFSPEALGDYRMIVDGKRRRCRPSRDGDDCRARAVGIMQLWPWARRHVDRADPDAAAEFWLRHVASQLSLVERCRWSRHHAERWGGRTARLWLAANARAVRPPGGLRCNEFTNHARLWRRWLSEIRQSAPEIRSQASPIRTASASSSETPSAAGR